MLDNFCRYVVAATVVLLLRTGNCRAEEVADADLLGRIESTFVAGKSGFVMPKNVVIPTSINSDDFNAMGFCQGLHPADLAWSLKLNGIKDPLESVTSSTFKNLDISFVISEIGNEFSIAEPDGRVVGTATKAKQAKERPAQLRRLLSEVLRYDGVVISTDPGGVVVITNRDDLGLNAQAMIVDNSAAKLVLPPGERPGKAILQLRARKGYFAVFSYVLNGGTPVEPGSKVILDVKSRAPSKKRGAR